jgi:hypothetical protein
MGVNGTATFAVDTDEPTISGFEASNPRGTTVEVRFESDQRLSTIEVPIRDDAGNLEITLTAGDFSDSGAGPYTYTATWNARGRDTFEVALDVATDDIGNDGATGQTDTVQAGGPPDPGPRGPRAYSDENGNGQYDSGEQTYENSELRSFDRDVNLVIPSDVGTVDGGNQEVSIEARSVRSDVDITSRNKEVSISAGGDVTLNGDVSSRNEEVSVSSDDGDVTVGGDVSSRNKEVSLSAEEGSIVADGASITSRNEQVSLEATSVSVRNAEVSSRNKEVSVSADGGRIDAVGATITSRNEQVTLEGRSIDAAGATITSENKEVTLTANDGPLDLTGATVESRNEAITLTSNGDMTLDGATIRSRNKEATADLGTDSATLSVVDAVIDDNDADLTYEPDGVSVSGDPASGTVGGDGGGNGGGNGNGNGNGRGP